MTTELRAEREADALTEVGEIIAATREAVESGKRHWFIAVLEGVGRWPLAEEEVDGRRGVGTIVSGPLRCSFWRIGSFNPCRSNLLIFSGSTSASGVS